MEGFEESIFFHDFPQKTVFFEDGFLVSIFVSFCTIVLKKKSEISECILDIGKKFIVVEYSMSSEYSTENFLCVFCYKLLNCLYLNWYLVSTHRSTQSSFTHELIYVEKLSKLTKAKLLVMIYMGKHDEVYMIPSLVIKFVSFTKNHRREKISWCEDFDENCSSCHLKNLLHSPLILLDK